MKIIDSTLREGEQTAGISFSLAAKKRIIDGLVASGVDEIELGIASREYPDLPLLCDYLHSRHPRQPFSLWCRCLKGDILYAASLRPSVLALSMPASDLHLTKKLKKDRRWALRNLQHSVESALQAGLAGVAVGLEDASRAEPEFILQLARTASRAGAFRLRLADTVGVCSPADVTRLLDLLKGTDLELGLHCHNDFGMATANTITGLSHGADWGDATILGLGERAGNSRLEEVISYLVLTKENAGYSLEPLISLSRFVAAQTGREVGPARPILGSEIFTCETGIHLQGLLTDPATYEPFAPERVGIKRKVSIGRKAGRSSISVTLRRLGLDCPDESSLSSLTRRVRHLAARLNRSLSDEEIIRLATIATRKSPLSI